MNFAIVRLGKDSVAEIRLLDAQKRSPDIPIRLAVRCAQVPAELTAGDYTFLVLGSDNNKGIPTDWVRGVRALGIVVSKTGGPGYSDQWDVGIEVRVVLPGSIGPRDLLASAPDAYYWSSDIPVIGVDTHSNQTIQLIKADEPNQSVSALAYGITAIYPAFRPDAVRAFPELETLFKYAPSKPRPSGASEIPEGIAAADWLERLAIQFRHDAGAASLRVDPDLAARFIAALLSKRFLIATGLAGSGKTKLAQAFARWLTPAFAEIDPFFPGAILEGAKKTYRITNADQLGIEVESEEGVRVLLPRGIIEQWARYVEDNGISDAIGAQELRDRIKGAAEGPYSDALQNFESHYKPAAFALLRARRVVSPARCYEVIPVGADWTGNDNIVGYPNGLDAETYMTRPALELFRQASLPSNAGIPHFLILDEMNLSHVERYFADVLSAIESEEVIPLYEGAARKASGQEVPRRLALPENLFIVGTVNVDETTYMFSPKVLDRANVIEFRMESADLKAFLADPRAPHLASMDGKGAAFGSAFVAASADRSRQVPVSLKADFEAELLLLFSVLREHSVEFGYRTAYEAARFVHFYDHLGALSSPPSLAKAMDAVVVQKLLPKLHGSRSKLEGLLWALAWACGAERRDRDGVDFQTQLRQASEAQDEAKYGPEVVWATLSMKDPHEPPRAARYPLSFDKIMRMWRKLVRDQFVTFSEA